MGIIGSIFSGIFGSNAANKAANVQADASNHAADLEKQAADQSLAFQKQQYQNSLQMLNPYLQTGYGSLNLLRTGLGIGGANPQGFSLPTGTTSAASLNPVGGGSTGGVNFGAGGVGSGPSFSPIQDSPGIRSNNPLLSRFSGNMAFDGNGSINGGINPGNASALQNPDIGQFNAGNVTASAGAPISANGGPLQVPRTDGGTVPGGGAAGGVDASGNPNIGFGSLLTPFSEQFKAPTDVTQQNDPGYQFRLNQGTQALQNSAAAKGGLFSGGTAKALNDYAQGSASNEYSNVYNRALNEYLNRYNIFNSNQTNQFNRLASVSGLGQTAANQLSTAGLTTGQNVGNTLLGSAGQIGQDYQNAAAAKGSGYVGSANAINGAIGNVTNMAQLLSLIGGL